ncbi:DUF2750 domain-containing protein, partial [Vibrio cholerae]
MKVLPLRHYLLRENKMSKLTADIEANLALFIQETQESQLVWGLRNEEGWLSC